MNKEKSLNLKAMLFVVVLTSILLSWDINGKSLWADELFSINAVRSFNISFSEFINFIIKDVHPPLYFFILSIWSEFTGIEDAYIRYFSVLCAIATIIVNYFLVRIILPERLAVLSSFFTGISPFFLLYSRMARYYVMEGLLVSICNYLFLKIFTGVKSKIVVILYISVSAAMAWTFYPAFLITISHVFCFIVLKDFHKIPAKYWIFLNMAISFLVLPVVILGIRQTSRFSNDIGADLSSTPVGALAAIGNLVYEFYCGGTIFPWEIPAILMLSVSIIFTLAGILFLLKFSKQAFFILIIIFLIPTIGMLIIFNTIAINHSFILFASRCFFVFPVFITIMASGFYSLNRASKFFIPFLCFLIIFPSKNYFYGQSFLNPIYVIPSREIAENIVYDYGKNNIVIAPDDTGVIEYLKRLKSQPDTYEYRERKNAFSAIEKNSPPFVTIVYLGRDRTQRFYLDDPSIYVESKGYILREEKNYVKIDKNYIAFKEYLFKKPSYRYKLTVRVYKNNLSSHDNKYEHTARL